MSVIKPALTGQVARTAGITAAATAMALGALSAPAAADSADPSTSLELCSTFPEDLHRTMKVELPAVDEKQVKCMSTLVEGVHRPLHQTLDGINRGLGGPDRGLDTPQHDPSKASNGPEETGPKPDDTTRDQTSDAELEDEEETDEEDEDVLRLVERALDLFL
ncbi:hypothetical protein GCM10009678_19860 [Actinomadura kijaniata]|uniref:Uncharacterized protein n=1 Tax=Actinomadura namibiensis TaxID=182080 RepID=A0A7W3QQZ2_ACTNM|nr:hypothetical protein [Actinomadura namibiensis]MBA8956230.1 hypothetical protein [Actinomadura namibiensis]